MWKGGTLYKCLYCVRSRECSVNCVDGGIVIDVEAWRLKGLRDRSGAVRSVGLKMCECYRRNCKTRCDKLMNWRLGTGAGRKVTAGGSWEEGYSACKANFAKCMVVGDSMLRNVWKQNAQIWRCSAFRGLKPNSYRVIDRRDLGSQETVIIQCGTNYLTTRRNLDCVMGEVCALVATTKSNLPNCRLVLCGVLRHSDVSWRRIGTLNDTFDWVANASLIRTAE